MRVKERLKKLFPSVVVFYRSIRKKCESFGRNAVCRYKILQRLMRKRGWMIELFTLNSVYEVCKNESTILWSVDNTRIRQMRGEAWNEESFENIQILVPMVDVPCAPIYVGKLYNAQVIGNTDFVLYDGKYLTDRVMWDKKGLYRIRPNCMYSIQNDRCLIVAKQTVEVIEKGIDLLGRWSVNYYHLTIDILPRLYYLDAMPQYRTYPLLLSEVLRSDPRNEELVKKANQYGRKIIYLKEDVCYTVRELIFPSLVTWPIWDYENRDVAAVGSMDTHCLKNVSKRLLVSKGPLVKKIYVTRGDNRRLSNESEIECIFSQCGFNVVNTGKMSLEDEIYCFAQASVIVGVVGAAFTNTLYCGPGTKVFQICPLEFQMAGAVMIGDLVSAEFHYIDAELENNSPSIYMAHFYLPENRCWEIIKKYGLDA